MAPPLSRCIAQGRWMLLNAVGMIQGYRSGGNGLSPAYIFPAAAVVGPLWWSGLALRGCCDIVFWAYEQGTQNQAAEDHIQYIVVQYRMCWLSCFKCLYQERQKLATGHP
eukprot:1150935-Pelagomonas_calceolata.AAC.14